LFNTLHLTFDSSKTDSEMNRLQILFNAFIPKRKAIFNFDSASFSSGTKKISSKIAAPDAAAKQVSSDLNHVVVEVSILVSRGLAAFGILYVVTEYGG